MAARTTSGSIFMTYSDFLHQISYWNTFSAIYLQALMIFRDFYFLQLDLVLFAKMGKLHNISSSRPCHSRTKLLMSMNLASSAALVL